MYLKARYSSFHHRQSLFKNVQQYSFYLKISFFSRFFRFFLISVMLNMPFWNGSLVITYGAQLSARYHVPIDSEWPKIMFYISPQLEETRGISPRNLITREPPYSRNSGKKYFSRSWVLSWNLYSYLIALF